MTILRQQRINVLDESTENPVPYVPPAWQAQAKCLNAWDAHYPKRGRIPNEYAKNLCAGCPVIEQCLASAVGMEKGLPVGMRHGVWGGTLPVERYLMESDVICRACPEPHLLTAETATLEATRVRCREARRQEMAQRRRKQSEAA